MAGSSRCQDVLYQVRRRPEGAPRRPPRVRKRLGVLARVLQLAAPALSSVPSEAERSTCRFFDTRCVVVSRVCQATSGVRVRLVWCRPSWPAAGHRRTAPASGWPRRRILMDMQPPPLLDGAHVLFWAWFDPPLRPVNPPGYALPIHAAAVVQYTSGRVYRFHCDQNWEVQGDWDCDSVEEALGAGLRSFPTGPVSWRRFGR